MLKNMKQKKTKSVHKIMFFFLVALLVTGVNWGGDLGWEGGGVNWRGGKGGGREMGRKN